MAFRTTYTCGCVFDRASTPGERTPERCPAHPAALVGTPPGGEPVRGREWLQAAAVILAGYRAGSYWHTGPADGGVYADEAVRTWAIEDADALVAACNRVL
jgi:hypothetical protein